jgi:membrane protease YdiL (CAAX protease family)
VPAVIIANVGVRERWARLTNLAIVAGATFLIAASGVYNLVLALLGVEPSVVPPAILVAAAAIAAATLVTPVRVGLARLLPIDPESPVALLALVGVILIVGLQASYQAGHDALAAVTSSAQLQPIDVVAQEIPILVLALLGVGLFTRRSARSVLDRLGVVRPAPWQVATALAVAGLFLATSQGAESLQRLLDPGLAQRLNSATNHYYGGISGVVGIAVIALAPGIAEEAFFRGALQPRLGILLAALAFAAVHTQYALTVDTGLIFLLGCGLGLVRRWLNTTSSMVAHAAYNTLAGLGIPAALLPWAIPLEGLLILVAATLWWASRRSNPAPQEP